MRVRCEGCEARGARWGVEGKGEGEGEGGGEGEGEGEGEDHLRVAMYERLEARVRRRVAAAAHIKGMSHTQ